MIRRILLPYDNGIPSRSDIARSAKSCFTPRKRPEKKKVGRLCSFVILNHDYALTKTHQKGVIRKIPAKEKPVHGVFFKSLYSSILEKISLEEIFKFLLPTTIVKVI